MDSIIGIYVGNIQNHSGTMVFTNDTVYVMRKSDNQFCILNYRYSEYFACFEYNKSNSYRADINAVYTDYMTAGFSPKKNTMSINFVNYSGDRSTFSGKKIK